MVFIILHFGWGLAVVILVAPRRTFLEDATKQSVGYLPYAITQLPVDFAIAGSLCILLYKRRTGFRRTKTLINTLILYAVNRCIFTSVVALVEALAVGIAPDSYWYSAAEYVIGQLYTNSLLAMLNSQDSISDGGTSWSADLNILPLQNLHVHSHPVALPLQNITVTGTEHKNEDSAGRNSTYDNDMSDCRT
ncbi:hypothetical protein BDP27DRAFT_380167 [Rhodocollybia butyracea]|uniref:DUF6534 domain-containing protein n=1 Tax=Rhodocollybia butyracea TaxID=206335 RepID=A0A9P5P432_9AGAR|nr:hypothetical protein BDP27DRAFT_1432868 [Rhodocollybia butyracea]KAF9060996.1 hypothetical protein BDP27DRAFT_380167 [Rhodocollybia butyracea]